MNELRPGRPSRCLAGLVVCLLAIAGCAVGPDYHGPPATKVPDQWKAGAPWKVAEPRDAEIKQKFWEVFDDPVLNGLEEETTTNSPDVQAAFEQVEQARAIARISRSDLFPSASVNPSASRNRYSQNRPIAPGATVQPYTSSDFVLPLDLSYEVDLWGRVRRSFRASREQAQAGAAQYQNVLLSLQAEVAQTYFTIRYIDLDRKVFAETIDLRQKNLSLVESLHRGGADSAVDVAEAETELASAQADLVGLDLRRAQLEDALAVLCGRNASDFTLPETSKPGEPPQIPIGLPSDLLERRPDVAQAERSMAAASEEIGVAKAAFFPSLTLTGTAGVESADLKTIFDWESRMWAFGPNVSLPIFEGGRNRAGLEQARAAYLQAIAQYRSEVLVAFREVEDGLVGLRLLKDQYDDQMRAVTAAKQAADLSRLRYKEGLASYFEVVEADRTALDNQILAYDLNGQRTVTTVLLIKAMGGGWQPNNPLMSTSVAPVAPHQAQGR